MCIFITLGCIESICICNRACYYFIEAEDVLYNAKRENVVRVGGFSEVLSIELCQAGDPNYRVDFTMTSTNPISALWM